MRDRATSVRLLQLEVSERNVESWLPAEEYERAVDRAVDRAVERPVCVLPV